MQLSEIIIKITNKKVLIPLVAVVVVVEGFWAYSVLFKKSTQNTKIISNNTPVVSEVKKPAAISLQSTKLNYKIGEKIVVSINITSPKIVDGVDIIMSYDPTLVSADEILPGALFSDYPVQKIDEVSGKVSVSGISASGGITPTGLFGSVSFTAKKAGKAKISVDFVPNSTTDSNVVESQTAVDLLGQVNNLEVNITP